MDELKQEVTNQEVSENQVEETVEKQNKNVLTRFIVLVLVIALSFVVAIIAWLAIKTVSDNINSGAYKDKTVYVGNPKNFEYEAMIITIGDKLSFESNNDMMRIYNEYYEINIKIVSNDSMDEFALLSFIKSDLPKSDSTVYQNKTSNNFYYSTSEISDQFITDIYIQNNDQLYNLEITSKEDVHFVSMFVQWANSIAFKN